VRKFEVSFQVLQVTDLIFVILAHFNVCFPACRMCLGFMIQALCMSEELVMSIAYLEDITHFFGGHFWAASSVLDIL
jgi:type IV secretory pathway VirB3-like protein